MANCSLIFGAYSEYCNVTLRFVTLHALKTLLFTRIWDVMQVNKAIITCISIGKSISMAINIPICKRWTKHFRI